MLKLHLHYTIKKYFLILKTENLSDKNATSLKSSLPWSTNTS